MPAHKNSFFVFTILLLVRVKEHTVEVLSLNLWSITLYSSRLGITSPPQISFTMVDSPKKDSQFAVAAPLFQKKDRDLKIKEEEAKKRQEEAAEVERWKRSQFAGAAAIFQQRAGASAGNLDVTMSPRVSTSRRSSLSSLNNNKSRTFFVVPPPGGPGAAKSQAEKGWKSQSSEPSPLVFDSSPYLKKPSGAPISPPKNRRPSFSIEDNYPRTSYLNKGADITPTWTMKPSVQAVKKLSLAPPTY
jgi:hypothetical protein